MLLGSEFGQRLMSYNLDIKEAGKYDCKETKKQGKNKKSACFFKIYMHVFWVSCELSLLQPLLLPLWQSGQIDAPEKTLFFRDALPLQGVSAGSRVSFLRSA